MENDQRSSLLALSGVDRVNPLNVSDLNQKVNISGNKVWSIYDTNYKNNCLENKNDSSTKSESSSCRQRRSLCCSDVESSVSFPFTNFDSNLVNSLESVDKSLKSVDKSLKRVDKSPKSVDKLPESVDKSQESVDKSLESVDKSQESVDKSLESVDKSLESVDNSFYYETCKTNTELQGIQRKRISLPVILNPSSNTYKPVYKFQNFESDNLKKNRFSGYFTNLFPKPFQAQDETKSAFKTSNNFYNGSCSYLDKAFVTVVNTQTESNASFVTSISSFTEDENDKLTNLSEEGGRLFELKGAEQTKNLGNENVLKISETLKSNINEEVCAKDVTNSLAYLIGSDYLTKLKWFNNYVVDQNKSQCISLCSFTYQQNKYGLKFKRIFLSLTDLNKNINIKNEIRRCNSSLLCVNKRFSKFIRLPKQTDIKFEDTKILSRKNATCILYPPNVKYISMVTSSNEINELEELTNVDDNMPQDDNIINEVEEKFCNENDRDENKISGDSDIYNKSNSEEGTNDTQQIGNSEYKMEKYSVEKSIDSRIKNFEKFEKETQDLENVVSDYKNFSNIPKIKKNFQTLSLEDLDSQYPVSNQSSGSLPTNNQNEAIENTAKIKPNADVLLSKNKCQDEEKNLFKLSCNKNIDVSNWFSRNFFPRNSLQNVSKSTPQTTARSKSLSPFSRRKLFGKIVGQHRSFEKEPPRQGSTSENSNVNDIGENSTTEDDFSDIHYSPERCSSSACSPINYFVQNNVEEHLKLGFVTAEDIELFEWKKATG